MSTAHSRTFFFGFRPELQRRLRIKKMSGRWGDRPLGRGGWRVTVIRRSPALPALSPRSRAAKGTQEIALAPLGQTTSDYAFSFLFARSTVDRPRGSFCAVLFFPSPVLRDGTEVPHSLRRIVASDFVRLGRLCSQEGYRPRITCSSRSANSASRCRSSSGSEESAWARDSTRRKRPS